jgi:CTP synthase
VIARCDGHLPEDVRRKISLFCNVRSDCVIENTTVDDLYEAPLMLEKQNLSSVVCRTLHIDPPAADLSEWQCLTDRIRSLSGSVTVALCGKYVRLHDAYLSVIEALKHGGYENGTSVKIRWIETEDITRENAAELFAGVSGICVPGGFGSRGIQGMINAAEYARENNIPYLGLCLGMQTAVIEFARNVLGFEDADSNEFNENSTHKVIDFMPGQSTDIDKGGTMRLGAYPCILKEGSLAEKCYGRKEISERHRHRYEFNNDYRDVLKEAGLVISGLSPDGTLVETVELADHPFYLGVQYHPEFKSRPNRPHPVFREFVSAALQQI